MKDATGFGPETISGSPEELAPGVARLEILIVNAYLVGAPGGPWVLVDTGLPLSAALARRAATETGRGCLT